MALVTSPPRIPPAPPSALEAPARPFGLRSRNFILLALSFAISRGASTALDVVFGFVVFQRTGSFAALGWLGLVRVAPYLGLPLIGGVLADRVSRVRLLQVAAGARAASVLALAALVATGSSSLVSLLLPRLFAASADAIAAPAGYALIPDVVRRRDLLKANTLVGIPVFVTLFALPSAAGYILGHGGGPFTLGIPFAGSLLAVALLQPLREIRPPATAPPVRSEGLALSVRQLIRDPVVVAMLMLTFCMVLVPVLLSARLSPSRPDSVSRLGMLLLFAGVATTVARVLVVTVLQLRVPRRLHGRVFAVYTFLGAGLGGLALSQIGLSRVAVLPTPVSVAAVAFLAALVVALAIPVLRRSDDRADEQP